VKDQSPAFVSTVVVTVVSTRAEVGLHGMVGVALLVTVALPDKVVVAVRDTVAVPVALRVIVAVPVALLVIVAVPVALRVIVGVALMLPVTGRVPVPLGETDRVLVPVEEMETDAALELLEEGEGDGLGEGRMQRNVDVLLSAGTTR
jgi:hypothetical protein